MSKFNNQNKIRLTDVVRDAVVREVAAQYGVRPHDVLSGETGRWASRPRHLAMWRLRQIRGEGGFPKYSFPEIGRAFGRDHSSVQHACEQVERRMAAALVHSFSKNGGQPARQGTVSQPQLSAKQAILEP